MGDPAYRRLFAAARRRLEEAGERARSFTLRDLGDDERRAVADLLGWPSLPGPSTRVVVDELDRALRETRIEADLVEVLEALGGPLVDRRARRESLRAQREAIWTRAASHPTVAARPELMLWLEELRAQGLVVRGAQQAEPSAFLDLALQVVARLPERGILLPVLAADVTGDAHALDQGQPLTPLVLRAARHLAGWSVLPSAAAARRRLWAEVGVLCDPLSAQVLVLGLRPLGDSPLARHLCTWADAGEPRRLTLREITGRALRLDHEAEVFVCENPGVVATAAERLGGACAPLVCVEGVPSTAALDLLHQLAAAGARVRVHADFDWSGLRIGNLLAQQVESTPWQFDTRAYRDASAALSESVPLKGEPVEARWDPSLRAALEAVGSAVFEEQVIDQLIADLGSKPRRA
ncbi:TIGR02679 family protein [Haliangium sp.]|uniref:TIGR02679 family protein n=1 Tax=Haliangium sp. TaxID=2663208 RepID=UPI003D0C6AF0